PSALPASKLSFSLSHQPETNLIWLKVSKACLNPACCWILGLALLAGAHNGLCAATPGESGAFNAAQQAFSTEVWDRAEKQFAEYAQNFPDSARFPEAILFQSIARYNQSNYSGAITLLSTNQSRAGKWADQY